MAVAFLPVVSRFGATWLVVVVHLRVEIDVLELFVGRYLFEQLEDRRDVGDQRLLTRLVRVCILQIQLTNVEVLLERQLEAEVDRFSSR